MVWQIRCSIAACVADAPASDRAPRAGAHSVSSSSTRLCATAAHSARTRFPGFGGRLQRAREHVGETARRDDARPRRISACRPCGREVLPTSPTTRSRACRAGTPPPVAACAAAAGCAGRNSAVAPPAASTTPSSIGSRTIGSSSTRRGSGEKTCGPATNRINPTPSARRCEAVACSSWTADAAPTAVQPRSIRPARLRSGRPSE